MSRWGKYIAICIMCISCAMQGIFADILMGEETIITNASNDLMAAAIPIKYGDESFRTRILESTRGEREPIGLVLSGGSARAFAHIGVLRYMEEQGIVPDFIISNSMGSIIGMMYAAGLSPDQILEICSNVPLGTLFDMTIPFKGGLLDPTKFKAVLTTYLGKDLQLQDLPIPVMVICEDLATKRQVHIMEGDFYDVMNAAYALPVYYPPVEFNGHLLVDGGMSNLVPLNVAFEYADFNVVSTTFYDVSTLNLLNPMTVLNTAIDIGKRRQGVTELSEHPHDAIWVRCDVESTSFMEFSAAQELSEKGYESAASLSEAFAVIKGINPVSEQLAAIRNYYGPEISSAKYFYNLYGHAYQRDFSQFLGIGVKSFRYPGDDYYLRDDILFGPEYGLRWDNLELSLIGGVAWKSYTNDNIYKVFPSASLTLDYFLFKFIRLSVEGSVFWANDSWTPTGYARQGFELKFRQFDKRLNLSFIEFFEMVFNPQDDQSLDNKSFYQLLTAGMRGNWTNYDGYPFEVGFGGGYQLAGWFNRHFLYAKINTKLPLPLDMWININATARFSLDGKGNVPFFNEDGFRTADQATRMQGQPSQATGGVTNNSPYLAVGSISFGWTPSFFRPSFGEFLLFEDTSISIYCDLLWNKIKEVDTPYPWLPSFSTGVEFKTSSAFIGLSKLPMSIYVGYDQLTNGVVWGIWFGITD